MFQNGDLFILSVCTCVLSHLAIRCLLFARFISPDPHLDDQPLLRFFDRFFTSEMLSASSVFLFFIVLMSM